MTKIPLAILLVGIVGSIFIIDNAYAAGGGLPTIITDIMSQLLDHEARLATIESKTSTVIANSQEPLSAEEAFLVSALAAPCPIIDATATHPEEPEYLLGWCPDGIHNFFIIEDIRVTPNSLVLINLQDPFSASQGLGECNPAKTGALTVGITNFANAFILDCTGGPTQPASTTTLIYTVFN